MEKARYIIMAVSLILLTGLITSSCATTQRATIESQRQNFMLHNKSEYSRNKGKYTASSYDKWAKKNRRYLRKQRRRH